MIVEKNMIHFYRFYRDNYPKAVKLEHEYKTIAMYRAIINGFIKFIVKKVFEGFEVQLSDGTSLGSLHITGRKRKVTIDEVTGEIKGLRVDYGATNKLWAERPDLKEKKYRVYHTNEHSGGITYRITWSKERMLMPNKYYFCLIPCRQNKRDIAKKILIENKEYLVMQH